MGRPFSFQCGLCLVQVGRLPLPFLFFVPSFLSQETQVPGRNQPDVSWLVRYDPVFDRVFANRQPVYRQHRYPHFTTGGRFVRGDFSGAVDLFL